MKHPVIFLLLGAILLTSGCGYTRKSALPDNMKTIFVKTTQNKIPVKNIYAYYPGLELMISNAVVKRLNRDGNLSVVKEEDADVILETDLVGFDQEGLRFNSLENVEEYRLLLQADVRLVDAKTRKILWEEKQFTGDADFFISEVRSIGREEGAQRAVERLAKNIVDRVVEDW